jgi:hypothetical protein
VTWPRQGYVHQLRDHFDVTVGFIWDYIADPPEDGIKPWDTKFTVGLRWKP